MTDDDAPVFPPAPDPTGDSSVDALTGRLTALHDLPVDEHNALYTGLHNDLLGELNADPAEDHDTP
ncbi:hypothetical protein [Arthrobacter sp. CAN_C5]|uniref:hypothetical protein n=1 Tax=Arthrobacter sp. CAN_C5 TaxID=2760706 RepID=UPI001AEB7368|nr:hypothetical protein [Arthrobacter sp. CAN_C5]MBP2217464.1 hypothetical protein [Arthrobacter sp. CAN_C5]